MCIKENERKSENRWAFCIDINVMISFFKKEHHARVMFTSQTFFVVVNFVVLHPLKKNFVKISRRKFKSNHIWLSYVFVIVLKTIFSIFIILLLFNTNIYLRVFVITLYSHGLSKVVFFFRVERLEIPLRYCIMRNATDTVKKRDVFRHCLRKWNTKYARYCKKSRFSSSDACVQLKEKMENALRKFSASRTKTYTGKYIKGCI